jgi:hypothetical protein
VIQVIGGVVCVDIVPQVCRARSPTAKRDEVLQRSQLSAPVEASVLCQTLSSRPHRSSANCDADHEVPFRMSAAIYSYICLLLVIYQ